MTSTLPVLRSFEEPEEPVSSGVTSVGQPPGSVISTV